MFWSVLERFGTFWSVNLKPHCSVVWAMEPILSPHSSRVWVNWEPSFGTFLSVLECLSVGTKSLVNINLKYPKSISEYLFFSKANEKKISMKIIKICNQFKNNNKKKYLSNKFKNKYKKFNIEKNYLNFVKKIMNK